ncbi:MAG: hypothetical protein ABSG03_39595 [Bryobacteraceae bacterium]|jgi:hypothetical protein
MAANARSAEVTAIGQLLTDYNNLEVGLLHCVQQGIGDFDLAFKTMFAKRGETPRVNAAQKIGRPAYEALGLEADFDLAIEAIRHALQIRNQYAHWTWWDDNSGQLAIANLEDLAKDPETVSNFDRLRVHHVDMPLLRAQLEFFAYVDLSVGWVNYEGRYLMGKLKQRFGPKPTPTAPPPLNHR